MENNNNSFEEKLKNGDLCDLDNQIIHTKVSDMSNYNQLNEENTKEIIYDEQDLPDTLEGDFSYQIIERGEDYYDESKVKEVYKNRNKYIANVLGSGSQSYNVEITVYDEETAEYQCTCPCTFNCKHEYAVLIAISNLEYKEVELKEPIKEKKIDIKNIIESIPAEEIKKYIMSPKGEDKVAFEIDAFTKYFRSYYPKSLYEFYYNNLFNDIVLDKDYISKIESYIDRAKDYLTGNDFAEVFKIIKSIIEAYNDTNKLNFDDYVFDIIGKLSMLLRITYRKSNDEVKNQIREWSEKLARLNYYDNYYLEDLILSLRV